MARLKISDGNTKSPPPETRRTSQRVTRSANRQVNENKPTDTNKPPNGNGAAPVWTPGISHQIKVITQTKEFDSDNTQK